MIKGLISPVKWIVISFESKAFKDKDGLNKEKITVIYQKIQQNILDGFDFLDELIKAQSKKNRV